MELRTSQRMEQRLVLTQTMRQSLSILQMDLVELREYIQEEVLSNPLLELTYESDEGASLPASGDAQEEWERPREGEQVEFLFEPPEPLDFFTCGDADGDRKRAFLENISEESGDFSEMLREQVRQMSFPNETMRQLSLYLIDCLNEKGYFDFELGELAKELGVPIFDLEQALYAVQSLQPTGVGARTLSECLLLQLMEVGPFNAHTVALVKRGLPLLARRDYPGIANLLGCSCRQAHEAADAVCRLNPIPSQGYGNGQRAEYRVPEALIEVDGEQITVTMNDRFLPRVQLDAQAKNLLQSSGRGEDLKYLKKQEARGESVLQFVENRRRTIERVLEEIIVRQRDFFIHSAALQPMTMSEVADALDVHTSTISRAIKGKAVSFGGRIVVLKSLFTASIQTKQSGEISSSSVKRYIERFVRSEDPAKPLSDESIRRALEAVQLPVSRRTVTKYREELGIPSSTMRRVRRN
ncbi:MAG: RNA polymerase factor sigma-54 [Ndongobacter sp.]|nr:RNA polymerase factor sigma-54 [Ndongobacter sp.]